MPRHIQSGLDRVSRLKMKLIAGLFLAIQLLIAGSALAAVNETQITFTVRDIQAVMDKAPKSKSLIDGVIAISLEDSPVITLGNSPNRVGVSAQLSIRIAGTRPIPARISGSADIIYNESKKSFFLVAPSVESVTASFIPSALEGAARAAISNRLEKTFSTTPIYILTERRAKEWATWHSLKSIQIRKGEVIATLAPR